MPAPDRVGPTQNFNNVIVPNREIANYYNALEVDALLAGLSGGTLQTVDLSAYATTAYVDGELQKVYSKAEVDALLATLATGGTIDLAGYATTEQLETTKTEILTQATVAFQERYTKQETDGLFVKQADMVAPPSLDGYATEQYVDDSIARIPAPPTSAGRPEVYDTSTEPTGDHKDGDLWLSPASVMATARQVSSIDLSSPDYSEFRKSILAEVSKMLSGGKVVPPDIDWTPCTKVLGSGLIEARVLNGMIQLRGELTYTYTSVGSFSFVQRLPQNFPKPPSEQNVVVFGYEAGVAYRRVFVRFATDGGIAICGDAKVTGTVLNGAQAYAY